jgi:hypothetical protein
MVIEEMDPNLRQQTMDFQAGFLAQLLADTNLEYAQAPEELAERAQVLLGLIYASGILTDERVRKGISVERHAELLSKMIVDGVRTRSTR